MVRCIIIKNCLSESGLLVIARVLPLHVGKGFVQRLAGTEWDLPDLYSLFCIDCRGTRIIAVIRQGVTVVVIMI